MNVPVFEDAVRAVRAVSALARVKEGLSRIRDTSSHAAAHPTGDRYDGGRLDEREAQRLLASWGVPSVETSVARSAGEAARAARTIGGPLAMKVLSPDIEHKSEAGAVALGVAVEGAADEHDSLIARAVAHDAAAEVRGTLLAPMVDGVECILGVRRDPVFGPVVMVGSGGIFAEVLDDVALRKAPVDLAEAKRMIAELKGARRLEGTRGRPRCDIDALADAVAALSRFAAAHADVIESVDVNPFVVLPEGEGGMALDALVIERVAA